MGIICARQDHKRNKPNKKSTFSIKINQQVYPIVENPKPSEKIHHQLKGQSLTLSSSQKNLMKRYWQEVIMLSNNDIFHKTMLASITASPKINEIIASGFYCYRDLRKWPKLNKICQAQFEWFQNLIITNLNEENVRQKAIALGRMHSKFAQFGLKPHFLDIFQLHLIKLLGKLKIEDEHEKVEFLSCWITLMDFIVECMNSGYAEGLKEIKQRQSNVL